MNEVIDLPIRGRGRLRCQAYALDGQVVVLRMDNDADLSFWAELHLDEESLKSLSLLLQNDLERLTEEGQGESKEEG